MKNQPLVAFILMVFSWVGTFALTALAFYLAFTSPSPLTPITFFTVAICILGGNLLPISVYLIQLWWKQVEIKEATKEADLTLKTALIKAEALTDRLEEIQGVASKSLLVGNQIPEKIKERLKNLEAVLDQLDQGNLESFLGRIEQLSSQDKNSTGEAIKSLKSTVSSLSNRFDNLESQNETLKNLLVNQEVPTDDSLTADDLEPIKSAISDLKLHLESLRTSTEKVEPSNEFVEDEDSELDDWDDEALVDEEEYPTKTVDEFNQVDLSTDSSDEIESGSENKNLENKDTSESGVEFNSPESEEDSKPEIVQEVEEAVGLNDDSSNLEIGDSAEEEVNGSGESASESEDDLADDEAQSELSMEAISEAQPDTETAVHVQAIVGIANKLYIRGDEPYLSWEKGIPLDLVGIGEYEWKPSERLNESISIKILLNDDTWADGENLTLAPGEKLKVRPIFPKA